MIEHRLVEDNWLAYVSTFIQAYRLDEKQANSAKVKIYNEYFRRAQAYRERHKGELEKIEAELKSPSQDPNKPTSPKELRRRREELERPIRTMFVAMHNRLKALPSSEQRANVDQAKKKHLEILYKKLSREYITDKPRTNVGVASRPDRTTPTSGPAADQPGDAKPKPGEIGPKKETSSKKDSTSKDPQKASPAESDSGGSKAVEQKPPKGSPDKGDSAKKGKPETAKPAKD